MTVRHTLFIPLFILFALFASALSALAQTTPPNAAETPNGLPDSAQIINCTPQGKTPPQSVGTAAASGTYVPVADAAVIKNTNQIVFNTSMLEYKECILREVVNAYRHFATAAQIRNSEIAFLTGRYGNPLFQVNPRTEPLGVEDQETIRRMGDGTFDNLNSAFQDSVKRTILERYSRSTRKPTSFLSCPYEGDLNAALDNNVEGSVLDTLWTVASNPACNPLLATAMAAQALEAYNASALQNYYAQLSYGRGVYPRTIVNDEGDTIVTTPGSLVSAMNEMFLRSGYEQNQNANNVNEMVSGLFANIATQIISSPQGLRSLFQPLGGGTTGPSYLDRVVSQAADGINRSNSNVALQTFTAALAVETAYRQAVSAIANILTQTIGQLRGGEKQCWDSLTKAICVSGSLSASGTSCTGISGDSLTKIATSTQFSQVVVDNQIQPLASSTLASLAKSNAAITILGQLIATVANNPTAAQQAAAIAQYNRLLSQGAFHSETDVTNVQNQQGAVTTATAKLVQSTVNIWTGTDSNGNPTIPWDQTINPGTGWCNYQNAATQSLWNTRWK